jgi:hypothetical protein
MKKVFGIVNEGLADGGWALISNDPKHLVKQKDCTIVELPDDDMFLYASRTYSRKRDIKRRVQANVAKFGWDIEWL